MKLLIAIAAAACTHAGGMTAARTPTFATADVPPPLADHHMHLASSTTVEALTPTPLPPITATLPDDLEKLLRRRELKTGATPELVAELYTIDAVIRARRGGGWVRGAVPIARALNEYSPGYRLLPVSYEIRDATGYIAGYFARGSRHNATFHLSLQRENGAWRIAVDNTVPVAPIMSPQPVTADSAIAELDAAGIRHAVIHSVAYSFASPDYIGSGDEETAVRAENDWAAEQVARYPQRLVGFCGVNPLRAYAIREIERCSRMPRMRGVKLHFGNSRVTLLDSAHVRVLGDFFAAMNRLRVPIAAHIQEFQGYGRPQAEILLERVIPQAPDISIQIMHMADAGPGYGQDAAFEVLARAREARDPRVRNLYVDVASNVTANMPPETLALIARRLRQFGLDRVLFGSDRLPSLANEDPATAWAAFRRVPLTDDEFRTIAGNVAPYLR